MDKLVKIYADGVVKIDYSDRMIRILLGDLEGDDTEKNFTPHTKIIMEPNGFLSMVKNCNELVEKMKDAGVLKVVES